MRAFKAIVSSIYSAYLGICRLIGTQESRCLWKRNAEPATVSELLEPTLLALSAEEREALLWNLDGLSTTTSPVATASPASPDSEGEYPSLERYTAGHPALNRLPAAEPVADASTLPQCQSAGVLAKYIDLSPSGTYWLITVNLDGTLTMRSWYGSVEFRMRKGPDKLDLYPGRYSFCELVN
jgi:hypothetical protein